jgi:hypothetical protein
VESVYLYQLRHKYLVRLALPQGGKQKARRVTEGERGEGRGERGRGEEWRGEEADGERREGIWEGERGEAVSGNWEGEKARVGDRMRAEFEAWQRRRWERRGDGRNPGRKSRGSDGRESE